VDTICDPFVTKLYKPAPVVAEKPSMRQFAVCANNLFIISSGQNFEISRSQEFLKLNEPNLNFNKNIFLY
jgi:hypothetical protein